MKHIAKPFYTKRPFFFLIVIIASILVIGIIEQHNRTRPVAPSHKTVPQAPAVVTDDQHISPPKPTEITSAKRTVPILMYHYIRTVTDPKDTLGFNLSITPTNFEEQLKWLSEHHYHTMPLNDFCQGKTLEDNPIILTFDDGYDDAYSAALPLLQKYNFTGTFFIVSGFVNQPRYVTSEQLKAMGDAGMELGAHTIKHIDLATASLARQEQEINGSKQISLVFAYPAGRYSADTIGLVKKYGFSCAVTTHYGIATEKSPPYELPRVRISGADSLEIFSQKVTGKK